MVPRAQLNIHRLEVRCFHRKLAINVSKMNLFGTMSSLARISFYLVELFIVRKSNIIPMSVKRFELSHEVSSNVNYQGLGLITEKSNQY